MKCARATWSHAEQLLERSEGSDTTSCRAKEEEEEGAEEDGVRREGGRGRVGGDGQALVKKQGGATFAGRRVRLSTVRKEGDDKNTTKKSLK